MQSFYGEKSRTHPSNGTVHKMHVVLRKSLAQAVSNGLIPRNITDGVKPPRISASSEEIKSLDSDGSEAFLEAAQGERLEALYLVALRCGLREGELLALRWSDVDLEAAKPALLVRHTLTRGEDGRGGSLGKTTKSGRGRRVRLTRRVVGPHTQGSP